MSKKRVPHWTFLILAAFFIVLAGIFLVRSLRPAQTLLLPAPASQTLLAHTASLTSSTLDVTLDDSTRTLSCRQETRYQNNTGDTLDRVQLRLYPNAFKRASTTPVNSDSFSAGELFVLNVRVNGRAAAWAVAYGDETVLDVPVSLSPGDVCTLALDYAVTLPEVAWRFGVSKDVYLVGNAFAQIAVYESGRFRDDAYSAIGDPFYADSQNVTLRLTLPDGYEAAVSGALRSQEENTFTYECLGVRDVSFALSRAFYRAQQVSNDTLISVYARSAKNAQTTLEIAMRALDVYETLFETAYPYPTLTLAQGDLGDYGGMEYSGYAVISDAAYKTGGDSLELIIAHEIAHQWFGILVGSDQITAPWLDEAMSEYASMLYLEKTRGVSAFEELYAQRVEPALRITRPFGVTTGAPLDVFYSLSEYAQTVYQRGAGMLHGVREAVGIDTFCDFLQLYIQRFSYKNATREDFAQALRDATGSDWTGYLNDYLDG